MPNELSDRLKYAREEKNKHGRRVTQKELAEAVGMRQSSYKAIETPEGVRKSAYSYDIAEYLGIPYRTLWNGLNWNEFVDCEDFEAVKLLEAKALAASLSPEEKSILLKQMLDEVLKDK